MAGRGPRPRTDPLWRLFEEGGPGGQMEWVRPADGVASWPGLSLDWFSSNVKRCYLDGTVRLGTQQRPLLETGLDEA